MRLSTHFLRFYLTLPSILGTACSSANSHQVHPPTATPESSEEHKQLLSEPLVSNEQVRAAEPTFLVALTAAKDAICACVDLECLGQVQRSFNSLPEVVTNDIDGDYLQRTALVVKEMDACSAKLSQGTVLPDTVLRAPIQEDLAFYTNGIVGVGQLHAQILTSEGNIECRLSEEHAPVTVANFVGLARGLHPFLDSKTKKIVKRRYYDGLIFHRVISKFMIQGGDQTGTGSGGPGYKNPIERSVHLRHDKPGTLSMANAGPNTDGSQFFITEKAKAQLDGSYSVFGYCENLDVIKRIARVPKDRSNRPTKDVVIRRIEFSRH